MNEQEYIEQIIAETGYQPTKEQLDYLNAMSKLSRQEILLELRNSFTSYGSMQPLPELLKSYGANEQFIKTAQKEIAQWYWSNLGKIAEEGIKLTDFEMDFTNKFALDKLKELGLSDVEVNNAFMNDDFFKTGLAFTDPGMRTEFDNFLRENAGMSIFEVEDILNEVPDTAKGLDPEEDFNVAERNYENRMADMAAREPSEAELNRYIDSLRTADDAQIEAYNEMMASNTDTPTNVVDYQDTGIGGRPFEIEGGVPVDKSGNPIKSIGNADETITIYRVVPEGVDSVNANDWVFINKGQAEEALKNANANVDGNFNLIEMEVSRADVYPSTRGNLEMGYFPKDTPTNVVDDLAKQNELINNFVNSMKTEGNLEFYVKHSGTKVPASSIQYNPRIGKGSQIPGFYTEPLGIRDIKVMGGSGGPNAISNYYKVQVNSNNLLISAGGGKVTGLKSPISTVGNANLGNEIEKINWKIFEQETGLSWENDFNGKGLFSVERGEKVFSSNSQGFINYLKKKGLTDDQISSALRKSGIEGFVSGPTNAQYEVVLLDPNDELGIGKNINVQDATETDFVNNQSKVNQIDELIIDTPTNVVDTVGKKGIKWADARKALEDVNNWAEDIPILEERFIGNTNDKIILEIIPPEGNIEGLIPSEDYRLQASILRENGDIEIIKTYNNARQFGADGKNFFSDISSIDKPTNVVDDVTPASVVDEAVEYINNLNIDSAIKKEVKDKVIKVTGQASGGIPIPGIGQAIDLWETAVLVVGAAALAAGEIDELPKVIYNYGLDLYESILSGYNIPYQPAKRKEYTPNFERISSGLTWIDKLQPTSYVINPVIEEFQETAATTPTMEIPGFGTVPASEYYQPPVQSSPERDNINSIMTNIMTNISNAQGAYPRTARELELFGRNPIQVVPSNSDDKPEKVEYDSKEKQNLHDIYANLYTKLSNASARIE